MHIHTHLRPLAIRCCAAIIGGIQLRCQILPFTISIRASRVQLTLQHVRFLSICSNFW